MIKIATFTVPGQPRPKERPRFGRGRGYTTDHSSSRSSSGFVVPGTARHPAHDRVACYRAAKGSAAVLPGQHATRGFG